MDVALWCNGAVVVWWSGMSERRNAVARSVLNQLLVGCVNWVTGETEGVGRGEVEEPVRG